MPTVLIVCTANICRSPMAMALLRKKFEESQLPGDWFVASAGTWARNGNPASQHGSDLMAEWGMDISDHQSRVVDLEMLMAADLILTMESGHKEALRVEFTPVADRIFLLSEMIGYSTDIRDPYGGEKYEYLDTAEELRAYINEGFERIVELASNPAPYRT